jgi:D-alanyl-D-alanine carboxypeptidase
MLSRFSLIFKMRRRLFVALIFVFGTAKALAACCLVDSAIVVDTKTGEVIYSYNADARTQPASLAKMMTLLLTFGALKQKKVSMSTKVRISSNAASQRPSALGLKVGTFISVKDAILALVVKSANDIAVALAEHIAKNEKAFVEMMNKEAKRLGMSSTIFFNPSGWKNPRQLTTARDMAKLARALVKEYPGYYHFFSNKQFRINNKCIKGHYELLGKKGDLVVDGIKTGFVNASGYNLAASAKKGNARLIAVVLGGKTSKKRDALADLLLRKGFSRLLAREIMNKSRRSPKFSPSEQQNVALFQTKSTEPLMPMAGIYNKINKLPQ